MLMVACLCPINFTLIALISLSFLIIFIFRISEPFLLITFSAVSILCRYCWSVVSVMVLFWSFTIFPQFYNLPFHFILLFYHLVFEFLFSGYHAIIKAFCNRKNLPGIFYSFGYFLLDWVLPLFFASRLPCSFPIPPSLPSHFPSLLPSYLCCGCDPKA